MTDRKWILHRDPANPYAGRFTLGEAKIELPEDTVISLTLGERFSIWRTIVNGLVTKLVQGQLAKNPNLLYSELVGDAKAGHGLTMSVWTGKGKKMGEFRDSGAHKFAKRFFSWIFYSGQVQAYFLTFPANGGRIPTAEEGIALCKAHGRHFDGGKLVKKATRVEWGNTEAAS
jgi:hypothetical protein